jgi:AraC-like DNA-binding protein
MTPLNHKQVSAQISAAELLSLSVEDVAAKFGCAPSQLTPVLQQHFGCSLTTLPLELRLSEAARLLRQPGAAVASVAKNCGFAHAGLFRVCFQRRFGVSPSDWRRAPKQSAQCS